VDALTVTEQLPVRTLSGRRVEQPWEPGERYADSSTVGQRHREFILGHQDILGPRVGFNY
jgi:hypothetical protein